MSTKHVSVLLGEVVNSFDHLKNGGIVVDGTVGGGGHAKAILSAYPRTTLIGLDRDESALEIAHDNLKDFEGRTKLFKSNFSELSDVLESLKISKVEAILVDLGMSSFQLDNRRRGFSFRMDGPLDMRMGLNKKSAYDVINTYSKEKLAKIIYEYGEERFSRRIAKRIVEKRPIHTTSELTDVIVAAMPGPARKRWKNTVTRVFQAVRIEVNEELENLKTLLETAKKRLSADGRVAVISFHSLEDRMVKRAFLEEEFVPLSKKPVVPSENERKENPRSRSAKLRVAKKA